MFRLTASLYNGPECKAPDLSFYEAIIVEATWGPETVKYGQVSCLKIRVKFQKRYALMYKVVVKVRSDAWETNYYDVKILDVGVPDADGIAVIQYKFTPEVSFLNNDGKKMNEVEMFADIWLVRPYIGTSLNENGVMQHYCEAESLLRASKDPLSLIDLKTTESCAMPVKCTLKKITIVLDPGHGVKGIRGGKDMQYLDHGVLKLIDPNGLTYGQNVEYQESDITLDISEKLKTALTCILPQVDVDMTRTGEIDLLSQTELDKHSLEFRYKFANSKKADIMVSVHCNGGNNDGSGFEICYYSASANNIALSENIIADQKIITIRSRRHYQNKDLTALEGFEGDAAILIELGFIKNEEDLRLMLDKPTEIAVQIANGIKSWIDKKYK